jgi:hypothetical protein
MECDGQTDVWLLYCMHETIFVGVQISDWAFQVAYARPYWAVAKQNRIIFKLNGLLHSEAVPGVLC